MRPPAPLRKAPDRPADAGAARRRPAPNAPRGRSRPPKAPKGPRAGGGAHWGRRIFTLLAVVVFAAALYAFNQTFQPFHGDGTGSVVVNIPQDTDAAEVAKLLEGAGVVDSARFFELERRSSGERGDLRPGHYTLKKGMTNGAAITALTKVPENPKAAATVDVTLIEGPSRKENAPVVDDIQEGRGQLREGELLRRGAEADPRARRAEGHQDRRGLPLPGHVQAEGRRSGERAGQPAARRVRGELQDGQHEVRQEQEAHALRRADHRVDDRARGAAGARTRRWCRRLSTTGSSRVCL